jgi:hypothetical protein
MALKFRLRGLAETFIDEIHCPSCGAEGTDEELFATDFTKVTFEGLVVIVQCKLCKEIFVPNEQRLGIVNPKALASAVRKDAEDTGEPLHRDVTAVKLAAERLNAIRKGDVH